MRSIVSLSSNSKVMAETLLLIEVSGGHQMWKALPHLIVQNGNSKDKGFRTIPC